LREEAQAENEDFLKKLDENIQKIIKEQVKKQVKTSYDVAADLSELELKKILIEKMESNKSIHRSDEQRNLYKALVDAYECDKIILYIYGDTVTLKRRRDDEKTSKTSGKSTKGSKSHKKTLSESAPAEKPMHITHDLEEPAHQEFKTGATDDQPIAEASRHPEWFQKQAKPPTPDCAWNKTFPATHRNTLTPELLAGPTYELMKGSCKSLVELEFFLKEVYKATTDQLDWNNPEGQQYVHNLLKPLPLIPNSRSRRVIPFDHFINNDIEYLRGGAPFESIRLLESARDVYSKRRIIAVTELQIVEWHNYKHLDWITVCRDDDKLYKFKKGNLKRLRIQDIKDMLLLLHCHPTACGRSSIRCRKLPKEAQPHQADTCRSDLKRKKAYTAYSNPRGFIYQNKDKQNRLICIDELHKFSDGMLNDVQIALDDRLKGIRMKYLPQTIWRRSNKERATAMIQAIDKQLKTRRIMRSLEKIIGGRLYE
nr:hypothetical protein [Tanacetum cinerariifolium]